MRQRSSKYLSVSSLLLLLLLCATPLQVCLAATSVTTTTSRTTYVEGTAAGSTKVDSGVVVASDGLLSEAHIILSQVDSDDALSVSPFNGLSQGNGYDQTNRKLVVTGLGTAATYQSVLRTVSFYSPSQTPATADRTVTFQIYDDQGVLKSSATKTITKQRTSW